MNKVAEKRLPIRCGLVRPCSLEKEGTLSPPLQRLLDDVVGVQERYLMARQARLDVPDALHHIIVLEITPFTSGKSFYECGRDCRPSSRGGHFEHYKGN